MSTYWYLECTTHDPVITSGEVSQHTDYRLDKIREFWENRKTIQDLNTRASAIGFDVQYEFEDWMFNEAIRFILGHINCDVQFRNEYKKTDSILKQTPPL